MTRTNQVGSRGSWCAESCPRTVALEASLCMEFPRQGYWSGLPLPTPGGPLQPRDQAVSLSCPALAPHGNPQSMV